MDLDAFITRWSAASLSEQAHAQSFFIQLCAVIGVPAPNEDRVDAADYAFERSLPGGSPAEPGQIDCYKRGCFVMEAKQSDGRLRGRAWKEARLVGGAQPRRASGERIERTMREAKQQAEG